MPSWNTWVETKEAQALSEENTLIKVENVLQERISIIDLNCYVIVALEPSVKSDKLEMLFFH